jgi:1-acyl-sn-glycerol-3-phosphate acyltransferase
VGEDRAPRACRSLCNYSRAEVHGLDNIPSSGPSLLVGNHSGGTYIADTFILATQFYSHFGPERRFHQLAHDIAARLPATGLSRWGTVAASHENAEKAFDRGAPVLVYPGGDRETFRPSWHSDRIEFAGRKGFIKLALERGVPIVPVVAIGGQETALLPLAASAPPRPPAKITVEVRPPIDLVERFGSQPEPETVYEELTGEMQDRLSEPQGERTLPIIR